MFHNNRLEKYINVLGYEIILLILLTACSVKAGNISPYKYYQKDDPNVIFDSYLQGESLRFYQLKTGMSIPLHSIIVMPSVGEKGFLSIEFSRTEIEEKFIRDMFYYGDINVTNIHPFSYNGIEKILMKDKLILNLYSGVIFHLRNDMEFFPKYKTFKSDKVAGKVTEIKGKVFCSFDHLLIKEKLSNVFVMWVGPGSDKKAGTKVYEQPDGSYIIIMPYDEKDVPPKYPPKIVE